MSEFPYSTVPGRLEEFLDKIRDIGIPDKVTTRWLPAVGFGSKNDRSIIGVLKFVGLVMEDGTPSDTWHDYRGPQGGKALASAVMSSYEKLYRTYPDAHTRSDEELKSFFRGHSTYGVQAVAKAVQSFKVLVSRADFDERDFNPDATAATNGPERPAVEPRIKRPTAAGAPSSPHVTININIRIGADSEPELVDKLLHSLSKHFSG
jgi:hypothetical protein